MGRNLAELLANRDAGAWNTKIRVGIYRIPSDSAITVTEIAADWVLRWARS